MRFEAARTRSLYAAALALAEPGFKRQLAPALVMAGLYRELLEKIERGGFRVKGPRESLGAAGKARALLRAWNDYMGNLIYA